MSRISSFKLLFFKRVLPVQTQCITFFLGNREFYPILFRAETIKKSYCPKSVTGTRLVLAKWWYREVPTIAGFEKIYLYKSTSNNRLMIKSSIRFFSKHLQGFSLLIVEDPQFKLLFFKRGNFSFLGNREFLTIFDRLTYFYFRLRPGTYR